MDERKPNRGRFQIHLSTCVVMMFVLGALSCANFNPYTRNDLALNNAPGPRWRAYGQPFTAYAYAYKLENPHLPSDYFECSPKKFWFTKAVFADSAIALAILYTTYMFWEWKIRRKERQSL